MDASLWLALVILSYQVYAFDPSLSNGTCYFGPGQQAADTFIPCGNAAGGVQSCCQARDTCLSSNACFNGQFYVTYVAGCTDQDYKDAACPSKAEFADQQWVGLVRCHISNTEDEEWAPCDEPTQPEINKGNTQCSCDAASSTALFTDSATLVNIASLPVSAGNAIAWFSGFEPSTTISDSTTTRPASTKTSAPGGSTNTAAPGTSVNGPTSTSDPISGSVSPTLSTAAKAGIGVGAAIGVVGVGALFFWLGWHRRRRNTAIPPAKDQIRPSSIGPWSMEERNFGNNIGPSAASHKSWGAKSELPTEANEITTGKTSLGENTIRTAFNTPATIYQPYQHSPTAETSEMDASPAASTSGLAPRGSGYDKPGHEGRIYEMPG